MRTAAVLSRREPIVKTLNRRDFPGAQYPERIIQFGEGSLIRSVNREISVYSEYDEFLKLAHNPEMRFVFSNTTEAGIRLHGRLSREYGIK